MRRCIHFVGFRGDEYTRACITFGKPDFIHRGWDKRAKREIHEDDLVVFAKGSFDMEPSKFNYNDIDEPKEG